MNRHAVIFKAPDSLDLAPVAQRRDAGAVGVDIHLSGISTGTERLLFEGRMPPFPGLSYPLVPGYESLGTVAERAGELREGDRVFVPGARCYENVTALFGGTAESVFANPDALYPVPDNVGDEAVLLALAATAHHALAGGDAPQLIIGHGILGRLIVRLVIARGGAEPTVWDIDPSRHSGATGYSVCTPEDDARHDYATIMDASGAANLLDTLVARLAKGGEITLAGFYADRMSFAFPAAFMKEARLRIAAEWQPEDMRAVLSMLSNEELSLEGLLSHRMSVSRAADAYNAAFSDRDCLHMTLDWRNA